MAGRLCAVGERLWFTLQTLDALGAAGFPESQVSTPQTLTKFYTRKSIARRYWEIFCERGEDDQINGLALECTSSAVCLQQTLFLKRITVT